MLSGLSHACLLGSFPAYLMERWGAQSLEPLSFTCYRFKVSITWTAYGEFLGLDQLLWSCDTPGSCKFWATSSTLLFPPPYLPPPVPQVVWEDSETLQNRARQNVILISLRETNEFLTLQGKKKKNLKHNNKKPDFLTFLTGLEYILKYETFWKFLGKQLISGANISGN